MGKKLDKHIDSQDKPTSIENGRIEIYSSKLLKGIHAVFLISICGVIFYGIYMVPILIILTIWAIPLFIYTAIVSVKDYFDDSPDLIITDDYLENKKWPFKQIKWKNISHIKKDVVITIAGFITIFSLETNNPDDLIPYTDFIERFFYRFTKRKTLRLSLYTLTISADELFRLISSRINEAR